MWRLRMLRERYGVKFGVWLGYHLPMWVKYWAANDLVAKASSGEYGSTNVPDLTAMEVLKRTGRRMGWHGYAE